MRSKYILYLLLYKFLHKLNNKYCLNYYFINIFLFDFNVKIGYLIGISNISLKYI